MELFLLNYYTYYVIIICTRRAHPIMTKAHIDITYLLSVHDVAARISRYLVIANFYYNERNQNNLRRS